MDPDESIEGDGRHSKSDTLTGWRIAGLGMVLVGIPYLVSLPGLVDGLFSLVGLGCLVWGWYRLFQTRRRDRD
ncbi:hypothetical protein SAMN04487948_12210 [Halogranum amylolyticum]|uniref:Uncharacterized protein n=1 Tax=Halogranum amylolyticum TaxID=660520 RepID=A0A1H8W1E0_9EURY|nr:hypothetical protein [Halogranum amylolyticum]SEP21456.1 hypothetical protein SAMN04487948_12210 [Halogranum amylolyticum]